MEEHVAGGRYVVRAELPGVDPAKGMEVSVAKGILTIRAERHEERQGQHRSELRYGTFIRHIPLPVTADASDINATYHWGILQVSICPPGRRRGQSRPPHPRPDHRPLTAIWPCLVGFLIGVVWQSAAECPGTSDSSPCAEPAAVSRPPCMPQTCTYPPLVPDIGSRPRLAPRLCGPPYHR
jgi:hypothetical protein